jgi:hypothetical protein
MPRAEDFAGFQETFGQRRAAMRAHIARRVKLPAEVEERDLPLVNLNQFARARRNFAGARHLVKTLFVGGHSATSLIEIGAGLWLMGKADFKCAASGNYC